MSLKQLRRYLKQIEKNQIEMKEKVKSQDKIIAELRMENRKIMEKLDRKNEKENDQNESKEIVKPKYLSRPSLKCIMSYIYSNTRIELSLFYPKFRKFEKTVPLELSRLEITPLSFIINHSKYIFKGEEKRIGVFEKSNWDSVVIKKGRRCPNFTIESVQRVASALFEGRRDLRVDRFQYHSDLSVRQNIDVGHIIISSEDKCFARDYCNVVRSVDNLLFLDLSDISELRHPWVRNVKRLEKVFGSNAHFLEELPNLLAEKICIHSDNDPVDSVDLIRVWCQNRDRKVGSKLFLTFNKPQEEAIINRVFSSRGLAEIGFFPVSHEISSLRLGHRSRVRLTVKEGRSHVNWDYLMNVRFWRHLFLEVVQIEY